MYAQERQERIAGLVARRGRVSVSDVASRYDVTTETVRRDLAVLERAGVVRRVHGGAVAATVLSLIELAVPERDNAMAAEKDRIATAAVGLVPLEGGSVLFDAGTTTNRVAQLLRGDWDLTVVTNSVPIAARIAGGRGLHLHLLGGQVRGLTQAAVGVETVRALEDLRVDVAFIGANGVSVEHGLTTPNADEAAVKKAMVGAARRVVVLADSAKLDRDDLIRFATLDEVQVLITDSGADHATVAELEKIGVEVMLA